MKTFKAVLTATVSPILKPGTRIQVCISETPSISTTPDGHSRANLPGLVYGEANGQTFTLKPGAFRRTGEIISVRDPLSILEIVGTELRVYLRLVPGVMRNKAVLAKFLETVKRVSKDVGTKKVVLDLMKYRELASGQGSLA